MGIAYNATFYTLAIKSRPSEALNDLVDLPYYII